MKARHCHLQRHSKSHSEGRVRGLALTPLALTALLFAALLTTACASTSGTSTTGSYHRYLMRGSIVEMTGDSVVLCIGSEDGATVGQELAVYRVERGRGSRSPMFERVKAGRVRIVEIVNGHFARADVVDGEASPNWIVELEPASRAG